MFKIEVKKRLILFALLTVLVFIYWSFSFFQEKLNQLADFLNSAAVKQAILSQLIFLGLAVLSTMFLFFSSTFTVPFAVSIWGSFFTTLLLLFGWILGAIFSYLIGRFIGYPILRYFIPEKKFDYYYRLLLQNLGFLSVFLIRFTFPSEIPGYILGILRFDFIKYLLITLFAEIPYAFLTVYAIDAILRKEPIVLGLIAFIWLAITAVLVKMFYKKYLNLVKNGKSI